MNGGATERNPHGDRREIVHRVDFEIYLCRTAEILPAQFAVSHRRDSAIPVHRVAPQALMSAPKTFAIIPNQMTAFRFGAHGAKMKNEE
jgi:hypothetical protein